MAGPGVGLDRKLYRNTASYATPTWAEIENVQDLTINDETTAADASSRKSAFKRYLAGQIDISIEFSSVHDTDDADYEALLDAKRGRTNLDIAAMDGAIATSGNRGVRGEMMVETGNRNQPLDDTDTTDFTLRPALTANAIAYMDVA